MPLPIRGTLANITGWNVNTAVHRRFAEFCRCSSNTRMATIEKLFDRESHVGWMQYAEILGKAKNLQQWKARVHAVGCPQEAMFAIQSTQDGLRLMAVRFLYLSQPGDIITADLKDRGAFIQPGSEAFLSQ